MMFEAEVEKLKWLKDFTGEKHNTMLFIAFPMNHNFIWRLLA